MRNTILLTICILLFTGCGSTPGKPSEAEINQRESAAELLAAGNYEQAAESYQTLADDSRGLRADRYRLSAAEAWLLADATDNTATQIDDLDFDAGKETAEFSRLRLLQAELSLRAGNIDAARERLEDAYPPQSERALRGRYHLLQARIHAENGDNLRTAHERLRADAALEGDARLREANAVWESLRSLSAEQIETLQSSDDSVGKGWLELAQIDRARLTDPAILRRTLDDWQLSYPGHPASKDILPGMQSVAAEIGARPQHIALILPLTGSYAEAAKAVRDGFLAGRYSSGNESPEITIYSADELTITSVYDTAVTDGADWVVGPLDKQSVSTLIEQGDIRVPTFVLNYYEGSMENVAALNGDPRRPLLYQFALAPEDEARQIAERAWFDGHALALALTPASEWGDRIYMAFAERFENLGGRILERERYAAADGDFSAPVERLLNLDSSAARYQQLRSRLQRSMNFEPRRRRDADFLMLIGSANTGRQIGPQLQFHRAFELPVYASSQIFSGDINPGADTDMNGFIFADIPWLLDRGIQATSVYRQLDQHWPQRMQQQGRLFALGIDAYQLLAELNVMALDRSRRIDGMTGQLSLGKDNRIQRQLQWAKFVEGVPRPADGDVIIGE
ncbi:MAG: penicillin-binding protein activator [Gammaproteobacteria bacterium]